LVQGPTSEAWKTIDFAGFAKRQHRTVREPAIFEAARLLRSQYIKLGAVGYCFGGWAVFRLGAQLVVDGTVKEYEQAKGTAGATPLVDAVSTGHPTWLTKDDIDGVRVPTQILAPERDTTFTLELKEYSLKVLPTLGIEFDYRYFPGVEHAFISRGSLDEPGERQACERAKRSISSWFVEILKT
jgi:dienelactone hydrolase